MRPWNWDYNLPDDWKPRTDDEWVWFLVRKINYNDLTGLNRDILARYIRVLNNELDPGKRMLLEYYITGKLP